MEKVQADDLAAQKKWEEGVEPTLSLLLNEVKDTAVQLTPDLEQIVCSRCSHSTAAQAIG